MTHIRFRKRFSTPQVALFMAATLALTAVGTAWTMAGYLSPLTGGAPPALECDSGLYRIEVSDALPSAARQPDRRDLHTIVRSAIDAEMKRIYPVPPVGVGQLWPVFEASDDLSVVRSDPVVYVAARSPVNGRNVAVLILTDRKAGLVLEKMYYCGDLRAWPVQATASPSN